MLVLSPTLFRWVDKKVVVENTNNGAVLAKAHPQHLYPSHKWDGNEWRIIEISLFIIAVGFSQRTTNKSL